MLVSVWALRLRRIGRRIGGGRLRRLGLRVLDLQGGGVVYSIDGLLIHLNFVSRNAVSISKRTRTNLPQNPLRANHIPRPNLSGPASSTGRPNRNSKGLERTLCAMMVIIPISTAHMQRHAGRLRKAMQTMRDHLRAQIPDLLAPEADIDHRPRPAGDVDDRPRERLVKRRVAAPEPLDRLPRAERLRERRAHREKRVFGRVVVVDWYGQVRLHPRCGRG